MKRLLLPLLAALALPTAVNAEIWIDVANYYEGSEKGRRYVDASSIYKRGDWIYATFKNTSRPYPPESAYRMERQMKVNCKKGILVDGINITTVHAERLGDGYWKLRFKSILISEKSKNSQLDGSYNFLCKK